MKIQIKTCSLIKLKNGILFEIPDKTKEFYEYKLNLDGNFEAFVMIFYPLKIDEKEFVDNVAEIDGQYYEADAGSSKFNILEIEEKDLKQYIKIKLNACKNNRS